MTDRPFVVPADGFDLHRHESSSAVSMLSTDTSMLSSSTAAFSTGDVSCLTEDTNISSVTLDTALLSPTLKQGAASSKGRPPRKEEPRKRGKNMASKYQGHRPVASYNFRWQNTDTVSSGASKGTLGLSIPIRKGSMPTLTCMASVPEEVGTSSPSWNHSPNKNEINHNIMKPQQKPKRNNLLCVEDFLKQQQSMVLSPKIATRTPPTSSVVPNATIPLATPRLVPQVSAVSNGSSTMPPSMPTRKTSLMSLASTKSSSSKRKHQNSYI